MNALVHTSNSLTTDLEFSSDQVNIIKNVICPGIKDTELSYCLEVAGRLGANPILKEVHFIFQNVQGGRKVMVQLGIDFYRRRAMETGRLRGKEIEVCGEDGVWHDILPAGKSSTRHAAPSTSRAWTSRSVGSPTGASSANPTQTTLSGAPNPSTC